MKQPVFFLIVLVFLLLSCSKIAEPEFRRIDNFRVINIDVDTVKVGFGITYFNPNNFSVTVKETGADVYLEEVFLGRFLQDSLLFVEENSDFTVKLIGSVTTASFLQMDIKDIQKRDILVRADGSTKVGKAGLFITRKITYEGRHRLNQLSF